MNTVATLKRNMPIVSGFAEVNLIHTGIPAIKINVIAASIPVRFIVQKYKCI